MSRLAFFRQSGWMLVATVLNGGLMALVQFVAQRMDGGEFGIFYASLEVLTQISIPTLGLQTLFVQLTVAATTDETRAELAGAARGVLRALFALWVVGAIVCLVRQDALVRDYKLGGAAVLWLTLLSGLIILATPVFMGLLQGAQNFLWLGLTAVINGVGRLLVVIVVVVWLGGKAAGACGGILGGVAAVLVCAAWVSRGAWARRAGVFHWRAWLKRLVPMTLGLGVPVFMFSQDMITVKHFFPAEEAGAYGAARVLARAMVFLVGALTAVMIPKLAQSAARAEKSDALGLTFLTTMVVGGGAALFLTIFPELPLRLLSPEKFWRMAWLVPWLSWAMLPLALANVLVAGLMAREEYRAVPWLLAVAVGYGVALHFFHSDFKAVVTTLGAFGLGLAAVAAWLTWRAPARK